MSKGIKWTLGIMAVLVGMCGWIAIDQNGTARFWEMNIGDVLGILITGIVFFNLSNIIASRDKKSEVFIHSSSLVYFEKNL